MDKFVEFSQKCNVKIIDSLNVINLLTDRKKCMNKLSIIQNEKFDSFKLKIIPTIEICQNTGISKIKNIIEDLKGNYVILKQNKL